MKGLTLLEKGLVPIYSGSNGERLIDAKDLYDYLDVVTPFRKWVARRIAKYEFIPGEDFWTELSETSNGRPSKNYILKLDTAKEFAMVESNQKGRTVRLYFIEVEKRYRKEHAAEVKRIAQREAGKMVRNMLTDTIRDIIPESPHKQFAYPNYTKLIYKVLFGKTVAELRAERGLKRKDALRDFFGPDELEQIQQLELIITGLIHAGMGYGEIKDIVISRFGEQAKALNAGHSLKLAGN